MIDDYKQIYRQRVESQGLTRLELREQLEELQDTIARGVELSQTKRERLAAERDVLLDLMQESTPPPETPEQALERLRDTNPDAARSLEHTLKRQAVREKLAQAEEELTNMHPEAYRRPDVEKRVAELRRAVEGMAPNPVLAEQDAQCATRRQIEELRQKAANNPDMAEVLEAEIDRLAAVVS